MKRRSLRGGLGLHAAPRPGDAGTLPRAQLRRVFAFRHDGVEHPAFLGRVLAWRNSYDTKAFVQRESTSFSCSSGPGKHKRCQCRYNLVFLELVIFVPDLFTLQCR